MKRRRIFALAAVFAVAATVVLLSRSRSTEAAPAVVSGWILSSAADAPILGAKVRFVEVGDWDGNGYLTTIESTTDSTGAFTVALPNAESVYDAYVIAPGYTPAYVHYAYNHQIRGVSTGRRLFLDPDSTVVTAQITATSDPGGAPVPGVTIREHVTFGDIRGVTDASGQATIALHSGAIEHVLSAGRAGYRIHAIGLNTAGAGPFTGAFQCTPVSTVEVSGQARPTTSGTFAAGSYTLRLRDLSTGETFGASVASDGTYSFGQVPVGNYVACLTSQDKVLFQSVTVPPQITLPFDIVFTESSAGGSLVVHAVGGDGTGVQGCRIRALRRFPGDASGPAFEAGYGVTDASGYATFYGLPAGPYEIQADTGIPSSTSFGGVLVSATGSTPFEVNMAQAIKNRPAIPANWKGALRVSGTVRDPLDAAVASASVVLFSVGEGIAVALAEAVTGSSGGFEISGIGSGEYDLAVFAADSSGAPLLQARGVVRVELGSSDVSVGTLTVYQRHAVKLYITRQSEYGNGLVGCAGVAVTLQREGSSENYTATTDERGVAIVAGLSFGDYSVLASKTGYTNHTSSLTLGASDEVSSGFSMAVESFMMSAD